MKNFPNIILIILDTLSAKHMSIYNYYRRTTPFLETFVEDCMFYKYCFSTAPWTSPSHASIFTGLYPPQHGCEGLNLFLNKNLFYLPEILKNFGYRTYACSCNNLICKFFNFNRGFLEFYDIFYNPFLREYLYQSSKKINRLKLLLKWMNFDFLDGLKYLISCFHLIHYAPNYNIYDFSFPASLSMIKYLSYILRNHKNTTNRFFIFFNIMETHATFNPPTKYRNIFVKDNFTLEREFYHKKYPLKYFIYGYNKEILYHLNGLYDQEILCIDNIVNKMIKILKENKFYNDTLIIITADHGESLGEHNLVEHSFCLYNENLHIPLIIKYPYEFNIKGTDEKLRQNSDIFHTICEILDLPIPYNRDLSLLNNKGRKIALSYLINQSIIKIIHLLHQDFSFKPKKFMQPHISLITSDFWKIIKRRDNYLEMYYLKNDLYETKNLINDKKFKKKKMELENLINKYAKETGYGNSIIKEKEDIFKYFE